MTCILDRPDDLRDWKHHVLRDVRLHLSRREFLRAAGAGAVALAGVPMLGRFGQAARAAEKVPRPVKTGTFHFPRLIFHVKDGTKDRWDVHPNGDAILRSRLAKLTNINVNQAATVVRLAELEHMCRHPFVFATSEGYFDLPAGEERNLKEFLMRGGFVYADDCVVGTTGDRFFLDYLKMIRRLFPDHQMKKLPNDHEIYHSYFDMPDGAPFLQGVNHGGWGLIEKGTGRIMTFVTPGDIHCGWTYRYFTREKNDAAIRMGVNIIIYYLTH